MKNPKKDHSVILRINKVQSLQLKLEAETNNKTVSAYIRQQLFKKSNNEK
jgi:hypothetical protein